MLEVSTSKLNVFAILEVHSQIMHLGTMETPKSGAVAGKLILSIQKSGDE